MYKTYIKKKMFLLLNDNDNILYFYIDYIYMLILMIYSDDNYI